MKPVKKLIEQSPVINKIGGHVQKGMKEFADKTFNKWGPDPLEIEKRELNKSKPEKPATWKLPH